MMGRRAKGFATLWLSLSSLALASACGGGPPPVCFVEKELPDGYTRQPMEPGDWIKLVTNRGRLGRTSAEDCTRVSVQWPLPPAECELRDSDLGTAHEVALTEDGVTEHILPKGERLIWVITHRYDNGDGLGPVAWVYYDDDAVNVRAVGKLRARTKNARLQLYHVGGTQVLVAAGDACESDAPGAKCHRAARLLVRERGRFVVMPIVDKNNHCLQPGFIEFTQDHRVDLHTGATRTLAQNASLSFDAARIIVNEEVLVHETDPDMPDEPPSLVRQIAVERSIRIDRRRLVATAGPVWPQAMALFGDP